MSRDDRIVDIETEGMETEDMEERAAVEAAADSSAQGAADEAENINDRLPYVIPLSKAYNLDGEEIKEVDLSGLEDLTTADGEYIDRVMAKMGYHPKDKFRDLTYTKHIAMRVTNLPIEFFNSLRWKDQQANILQDQRLFFILGASDDLFENLRKTTTRVAMRLSGTSLKDLRDMEIHRFMELVEDIIEADEEAKRRQEQK